MILDQIEIFNNNTKEIIQQSVKRVDIFMPAPEVPVHVSTSPNAKPSNQKELPTSEDYPF